MRENIILVKSPLFQGEFNKTKTVVKGEEYIEHKQIPLPRDRNILNINKYRYQGRGIY
jgi:hypothetical protein